MTTLPLKVPVNVAVQRCVSIAVLPGPLIVTEVDAVSLAVMLVDLPVTDAFIDARGAVPAGMGKATRPHVAVAADTAAAGKVSRPDTAFVGLTAIPICTVPASVGVHVQVWFWVVKLSRSRASSPQRDS